MKNSNIEWCDHTFNPWEGCTKVSPGCANCYAENRNTRFGGGTAVNWGKGAPRRRTSGHNWNQPVKWNEAAAAIEAVFNVPGPITSVLGPVARPRVFCASLADWLDDEVPIEWLADLLDLIQRTPHLDWLLLTKRPENWYERTRLVACLLSRTKAPRPNYALLSFLAEWKLGSPPDNVWIGTTVEDQVRADERIPALLSIPARVRFLSCEPLLGPVYLHRARQAWTGLPGIDWVICGGESGPKARPMYPDWARSLRDQCAEAGVPFLTAIHFKDERAHYHCRRCKALGRGARRRDRMDDRCRGRGGVMVAGQRGQ
jgi:protein gp37